MRGHGIGQLPTDGGIFFQHKERDMCFLSLQIRPRKATRYVVLSALFAVATMTSQVSVAGDTGIDNSGKYNEERAWCVANTQGDERAACLRDSGAAQAEKRGGTLDNNGANFTANATQRCEVLAGADRAACKARVMGYGSTSGSVQGGGIIKQVETVVLPEGTGPVIINQTPQ
jgi:hypothetical protein